MDELLELRGYIENQQYSQALDLIGEMEEMSRQDKVNKIYSFVRVLLIHLIKQAAEKRTTRSWDLSIENALEQIHLTNQRRKSRGIYVAEAELKSLIQRAYPLALKYAALEAFGGLYEAPQLDQMVDRGEIEAKAFDLTQHSR